MASRYKRPTRPGRGGTSNAQGAGDSGGILSLLTAGILGGSTSPTYSVNQPVSEEIAGEGAPQQFYSPKGQVVEQPYSDTRNWFNRNIRRAPNEAAFKNNALAGQMAESQAMFPIELSQQRQLGALANQQELAQLAAKQELEKPYQPVIGSTAPGDIDYRLPVDAAAITEGRDMSLPYLPVNPASVEGNLKAQEAQSMAKYRTAQASAASEPTYMNIGGALVKIPTGGSPEIAGQTVGGYDVEEPFVIDPKTGAYTGGYKKHIPQQFNLKSKPVGRINLSAGGQENLGPVYEQPMSNAYFPFSGQTNEFPIGETAVNGNPPKTAKSTGGSPTTQPQTRLEGLIPDIGRAAKDIGAAGIEDISSKAKAASELYKNSKLNELLLQLRKALIRREPVAQP